MEEPVEIETGATSEVSKRPPLSRKSTSEVVQQRSKKYIQFARLLLLDPLKVIMYLQYPPVVLSIYYASVTFGSLYVLNISITYTFEREPYNFSTLIVGLLYIPNSIGYIVSSLLGGRWMDYIMRREAIKAKRRGSNGKLMYLPEDRMRENAWAGAVIYPAALLWYGWTAEKGVFWLAPVSHSREAICKVPNKLTRGDTDDCQLLLWVGLDAHLRHGDNHVDRVHAQTRQLWGGVEQPNPEYLLVCWQYCRSAPDRCSRQWMAIYYPGALGVFECHCDLGDEKVRASVAGKDGQGVGFGRGCLMPVAYQSPMVNEIDE